MHLCNLLSQHIGKHLAAAAILLFSCSVLASNDSNCNDLPDCVAVDDWHLSVAIGAGAKLNPLQDGDNIPYIILPDVAYYGESWYWDNAELGYQLIQSDRLSAEVFVNVNPERALFSFWHTDNILSGIADAVIGAPPGEIPFPPIGDGGEFKGGGEQISVDEIATRKWAADVGLRWHYYQDDGEWTLGMAADASDVHKGYQFNLAYRTAFFWGKWQISPNISLQWKSSNLIDYYYGIDTRDSADERLHYQGRSGWQPVVTVIATKPISENWSWLLIARYRHLHKGMSDSPIVRRNNIPTAFAGVSYRF